MPATKIKAKESSHHYNRHCRNCITKPHLIFLTYLFHILKQEVYEKQNRVPKKTTDSPDHNFMLDTVRLYFFYQPILFYL